MGMARVLHKDLANLRALKMDGFISCQIQRVCFPTGVYMEIMGRLLWDRTLSFNRVVDDYFHDVFGNGGPEVKAYLQKLSPLLRHELQDPVGIRKGTQDAAVGAAVVERKGLLVEKVVIPSPSPEIVREFV